MKKNQNEGQYKGSVYVMEYHGFNHNYDIQQYQNDGLTILKYADNGDWTPDIVDTAAGSVRECMDGATIMIADKHITLDFAEMEILTALILSTADTKMEVREHRVISSLNI